MIEFTTACKLFGQTERSVLNGVFVVIPQRGKDTLIGTLQIGDLQQGDTEITHIQFGTAVLHIHADDDVVSLSVGGKIPVIIFAGLIENDDGKLTLEEVCDVNGTVYGKADFDAVVAFGFLIHHLTGQRYDDGLHQRGDKVARSVQYVKLVQQVHQLFPLYDVMTGRQRQFQFQIDRNGQRSKPLAEYLIIGGSEGSLRHNVIGLGDIDRIQKYPVDIERFFRFGKAVHQTDVKLHVGFIGEDGIQNEGGGFYRRYRSVFGIDDAVVRHIINIAVRLTVQNFSVFRLLISGTQMHFGTRMHQRQAAVQARAYHAAHDIQNGLVDDHAEYAVVDGNRLNGTTD